MGRRHLYIRRTEAQTVVRTGRQMENEAVSKRQRTETQTQEPTRQGLRRQLAEEEKEGADMPSKRKRCQPPGESMAKLL